MKHQIDKKFLEMLILLIHQQNEQLARIIAEEEGLPLHHVSMHIPSVHKIKQMLGAHTSSSLSSSSSSSSSSLVS